MYYYGQRPSPSVDGWYMVLDYTVPYISLSPVQPKVAYPAGRLHCPGFSASAFLAPFSGQREVAAAFKIQIQASTFILQIYNYNNHILYSQYHVVILCGFNFKSVVAFQAENCETPVFCDNLLRDFLGLRSNVCPISSSFSSVRTWRVLWDFLSRTEPVSWNLFTSLRTVSLWGARISGNLSLNSHFTSLQDIVRT